MHSGARTVIVMNARLDHLKQFYSLMDELEKKLGGAKLLTNCSGRQHWPQRGVYFFREDGEVRAESGSGLRVVRVGTHALTATSRTKLWARLSQHRGNAGNGGGNHRGSIFRLIVGTALIEQRGYTYSTWGVGNTAAAEVRAGESALEQEVSTVIGNMPFLWLDVGDAPGNESARGEIERNAIALLSNFSKPLLDGPSPSWLGHACNRTRVRQSGLWNNNHVDENYDPHFLDTLAAHIERIEPSS